MPCPQGKTKEIEHQASHILELALLNRPPNDAIKLFQVPPSILIHLIVVRVEGKQYQNNHKNNHEMDEAARNVKQDGPSVFQEAPVHKKQDQLDEQFCMVQNIEVKASY